MAQTFALIAPVQPILHRVSCSNEKVPKASNCYETQQKMSLGSNGVDWVRSLRKIRTRLRGTNFFSLIALVQPILHRVSCSNEMVPNAPKHYEMHQNMCLGSDGVDRVDLLQKILMQLCGLMFCINYNSSAHFEPSIVKQRNRRKCPQTLQNQTKQNISLVSNGVDRVHSLRKIRTQLCGANFCIKCTISAHFAPSFML